MWEVTDVKDTTVSRIKHLHAYAPFLRIVRQLSPHSLLPRFFTDFQRSLIVLKVVMPDYSNYPPFVKTCLYF